MEGDDGEEEKRGQTGFSQRQKNIPSGGSSQVTVSYGRIRGRERVENKRDGEMDIEIMYTTNRRLIGKRELEISWKERRLTTKPGRRHHAAMEEGCGRELMVKEKVMTQREVSGGDETCQQNLSTRTEKDPYWRPRAETSKASERVRREEKPGLVSRMGKRTRRPEDENKEGHGGKPQDDTSSYENMCDIVG